MYEKTINAMTIEEIRERMSDMATTEQAENMRDMLLRDGWGSYAPMDIPDRAWLDCMDRATGGNTP